MAAPCSFQNTVVALCAGFILLRLAILSPFAGAVLGDLLFDQDLKGTMEELAALGYMTGLAILLGMAWDRRTKAPGDEEEDSAAVLGTTTLGGILGGHILAIELFINFLVLGC